MTLTETLSKRAILMGTLLQGEHPGARGGYFWAKSPDSQGGRGGRSLKGPAPQATSVWNLQGALTLGFACLARVPQLDREFDDFWISGRMEGVKTPMIPRVFEFLRFDLRCSGDLPPPVESSKLQM